MKGRDAIAIPSLDGLRAFSIGLVLLAHAIGLREGHTFVFRLFLLHGELGVRIFFVISGFLITTLLLQEKADFGSISLRLFYLRRALRILPAFCVFVAALFVLDILGYVQIPRQLWIYVLTYTVNFSPGVWLTGHLWSLSVEEQFYLLWPLALRFAKINTCLGIAFLAIFAGIIIRAVYVVSGIQLIDPALRYAFPFVAGPIATGCLLAIFTPWVRRLADDRSKLFGPGVTTTAVALSLLLDTLDLGTANRFVSLVTNALLTFCVARFVFKPQGAAAAVLNSRSAVFIGKLSYSLYLWQQLFLNPFSNAAISKFPINLCAAVAAALLSYFLIETKFLNLRKHFRREAIQDQVALSST